MARFFIAASNIFGGVAYLDKEEANHIKVLRIKNGETFTVCDGNGTDYICQLGENDNDGNITAKVIDTVPSSAEASVHCAVFAAFPKGDKAETIIQKCVELGANEINFFPSTRCIVKFDDKALMRKTVRWQKIALEAAKQSGRGRIPKVSVLSSFKEAVSSACASQLPLFLYEEERATGIKSAVEAYPGVNTVSIMTGPEGGFEKSEHEFAVNSGMKSVTIGPRILRCETAPVCAVSAVMLLTGNLD